MPQGLRVRVSSCPPEYYESRNTVKKGLRTTLSVIVDKKIIQNKIDERLIELQKQVTLKGFRARKSSSKHVIKNQFGKSIYGEVIDKILRETSAKAIEEKKLKLRDNQKLI